MADICYGVMRQRGIDKGMREKLTGGETTPTVEESLKRLLLSTPSPSATELDLEFDAPVSGMANSAASSSTGTFGKAVGLSEEAINQVDQFLRDALQNPRERLTKNAEKMANQGAGGAETVAQS